MRFSAIPLRPLLLVGVLGAILTADWSTARGEPPRQVAANRMAEIKLTSAREAADPFNQQEVQAVFTAPDGCRLRVPAFWAGGRAWRVRYASFQTGVHHYRTECSDPSDAGLHRIEGSLEITPPAGDNPLYRHGPVRVATDRRHFEHADGTPFLWLGDTWWMGLTRRLQWPEEFRALTADRVRKGFNVVQIVAGLYPDMPAFDDRGRNEMGFPWEKGYARINPAYFDAADRRIEYLVDAGISPCVVGAWGYHLPWLGVERMKRHWRYLVARWGALPVTWCVAGEGTMPYYLSRTKEQDAALQKRGWTEVAAYLRKIDPFGRPVTIHPPQFARACVDDVAVLDFEMLQTGHGDWSSVPNTITSIRTSRAAKPPMPTVLGEVCYEGILDTCWDALQRFLVWSSYLNGTAGHTYGANGIWQLNRQGQPYGASPHGGNWGSRPWDDAMRLPGSKQAGLARKLLIEHPWNRFEPHPEWCTRTEQPRRDAPWGDWIWYPEGNPAQDAPVAARFFRKTFDLPDGKQIGRAVLHVSVDDKLTAWLNGKELGSHADWLAGKQFSSLADLLTPGRNVLAVRGENGRAPVAKNPAGLIAVLEIVFADGQTLRIPSDATWRASQKDAPGWLSGDFDDKTWPAAMKLASYGEGPWGRIGRAAWSPFLVPCTAGIPKRIRVIYLPNADPAVVRQLETGCTYRATWFDPVTGQKSPLGPAKPDPSGSWPIPDRPDPSHDWVLVLDASAT